MGIIKRMRKQIAVHWALASAESGGIAHDDYGQPVLTDPVEIECRWEAKSEEFVAANGTKTTSRAVVYVDRDVDVGGVLMLGELTDVTDVDAKENEGAWEIKRFDRIPNLKATEYLRIAYL